MEGIDKERSGQQAYNEDSNRQPQGNRPPGIATVNGSDSQTPDEREAYIANEPGTSRLRSERKSVEESRDKGENE